MVHSLCLWIVLKHKRHSGLKAGYIPWHAKFTRRVDGWRMWSAFAWRRPPSYQPSERHGCILSAALLEYWTLNLGAKGACIAVAILPLNAKRTDLLFELKVVFSATLW